MDAFVMAAGTGGTISGVGAFLREKDPSVKICLIDPPGTVESSTPMKRRLVLLYKA